MAKPTWSGVTLTSQVLRAAAKITDALEQIDHDPTNEGFYLGGEMLLIQEGIIYGRIHADEFFFFEPCEPVSLT